MSVASTTLLHTIVVKVKTWHMGACVIAACTLLNRASDDRHRVVPVNTDLFIAADDAIEDEGMLEAMLMDDEGDGAPPPLAHSKAREFGAVCEAVTAKSAAAVGLSCAFNAAEIWRRWATQTASLAPVETASGHQPRGGCQPTRGRPAHASAGWPRDAAVGWLAAERLAAGRRLAARRRLAGWRRLAERRLAGRRLQLVGVSGGPTLFRRFRTVRRAGSEKACRCVYSCID